MIPTLLNLYSTNLAYYALTHAIDGKLILDIPIDITEQRFLLFDTQGAFNRFLTTLNRDEEHALLLALRSGCLLRCDAEYFRFYHKTLLEYFAHETLFRGALGELALLPEVNATTTKIAPQAYESINQPLQEPNLFKHWIERTQEPRFCELLYKIIEDSKADASIACAAGNAFTILNAAKRPVHAKCWDGVHIQGADLSGALLGNASFRGAHITDSHFIGAHLADVDFSNAQFFQCEWGFQKSCSFEKMSEIVKIQFLPCEPYLLVGEQAGRIHWVNTNTGKIEKTVKHYYLFSSVNDLVDFTFDGGYCADGNIRKSQWLLSASSSGREIHIWDIRRHTYFCKIQVEQPQKLVVNVDGTHFVVASEQSFCLYRLPTSDDRRVFRINSVNRGDTEHLFITDLSLSNDASQLGVVFGGHNVYVWNTMHSHMFYNIDAKEIMKESINHVCFLPNSTDFLVSGDNGIFYYCYPYKYVNRLPIESPVIACQASGLNTLLIFVGNYIIRYLIHEQRIVEQYKSSCCEYNVASFELKQTAVLLQTYSSLCIRFSSLQRCQIGSLESQKTNPYHSGAGGGFYYRPQDVLIQKTLISSCGQYSLSWNDIRDSFMNFIMRGLIIPIPSVHNHSSLIGSSSDNSDTTSYCNFDGGNSIENYKLLTELTMKSFNAEEVINLQLYHISNLSEHERNIVKVPIIYKCRQPEVIDFQYVTFDYRRNTYLQMMKIRSSGQCDQEKQILYLLETTLNETILYASNFFHLLQVGLLVPYLTFPVKMSVNSASFCQMAHTLLDNSELPEFNGYFHFSFLQLSVKYFVFAPDGEVIWFYRHDTRQISLIKEPGIVKDKYVVKDKPHLILEAGQYITILSLLDTLVIQKLYFEQEINDCTLSNNNQLYILLPSLTYIYTCNVDGKFILEDISNHEFLGSIACVGGANMTGTTGLCETQYQALMTRGAVGKAHSFYHEVTSKDILEEEHKNMQVFRQLYQTLQHTREIFVMAQSIFNECPGTPTIGTNAWNLFILRIPKSSNGKSTTCGFIGSSEHAYGLAEGLNVLGQRVFLLFDLVEESLGLAEGLCASVKNLLEKTYARIKVKIIIDTLDRELISGRRHFMRLFDPGGGMGIPYTVVSYRVGGSIRASELSQLMQKIIAEEQRQRSRELKDHILYVTQGGRESDSIQHNCLTWLRYLFSSLKVEGIGRSLVLPRSTVRPSNSLHEQQTPSSLISTPSLAGQDDSNRLHTFDVRSWNIPQ